MLNLSDDTSRHLRARAAHCRRLACGAVPPTIADQLEDMAEELERRADRLEPQS